MIKSNLLGYLVFCLLGQLQALFDVEQCYGDLGCFEVTGDFFDPINRPFQVLPNDPASIGTIFRLYTNENKNEPQIIDLEDPNGFNASLHNFDSSKDTKVIIHGFRETEGKWMLDIKDEYLRNGALNIITVDWKNGASIPYVRATSNTRVVGAQIAKLIQNLQSSVGAKPKDFHLIGFSLGSHVAGYAGQRLRGIIGRITGLDPAGPLFAGMPPVVRLDPTDAQFVDAIHTDAKKLLELSFGTEVAVGHVDFYPNGGHDQPGCPHTYFDKVTQLTLEAVLEGLDKAGETAVCRHERSTKLYLDSIRNPQLMVGYPCDSYDNFLAGECGTCGYQGGSCSIMGSPSIQYLPINAYGTSPVKLYLETRAEEPFTLYHYQIVLKTPKDDSRIGKFGFYVSIKTVSFGSVTANVRGELGQSGIVQLTRKDQVFEPDMEYSFLLTSQYYLGDVKSVELSFLPSSVIESLINLQWRVTETLSVKSLILTDMYKLLKSRLSEDPVKYCSNQTTLNAIFTHGGTC